MKEDIPVTQEAFIGLGRKVPFRTSFKLGRGRSKQKKKKQEKKNEKEEE